MIFLRKNNDHNDQRFEHIKQQNNIFPCFNQLILSFVKDIIILIDSYLLTKNNLMEKTQCMGCQTRFQDSQTVILQNLTTQYKNYHLPLKDDKHKWIILKTVVSFLNSQGGTIYIGIQDEKGTVNGVFMTRKQRDTFKLNMKHLFERINPKVDLNNKQQINIQFVPVVKNEQFLGKYVVKIIVQQGDPSCVYNFAQKIKLEGANNKTQDYQIFYAYERHNMGGTNEIKGLKLLNLIHQRAKKPLMQSTTFHQGCNPQPPHLQLSINTIHFTNTTAGHMKIMQQTFELNFEKEDIEYETDYLKEEKTITLKISDMQDFKAVKNFLVENIQYMNEQIFKNQSVQFEAKGEVRHYFHIDNVYEKNEKNSQRSRNQGRPKEQKRQRRIEKRMERPAQNQNFQQFTKKIINEQKNIQKIIPPKQQQPQQKQPQQQQQQQLSQQQQQQSQQQKVEQIKPNPNASFPKKYCLTFTHIQPNAIDQLQAFLMNSIIKKYDKQIAKYTNSVEVFFRTPEQFIHYVQVAVSKQNYLNSFGYKQQIRFGVNQGCLTVLNFDRNKKQQIKDFLMKAAGEHLLSCDLVKQKNSTSLQMRFKQKSMACKYLDALLQYRQFKRQFSIPNSHKGNLPKMKIYLQVSFKSLTN